MSHIARVEDWIKDVKRRMIPVPEDTPYYRELNTTLAEYEKLLAELQAIAKGRQRTLPIREPGDEG